MLQQAENACFAIADITGYTGFLAGVELDHAQDIIADLMDTVVRCLRPPFRIAKFEGDAAFVYAVGDSFDGAMVQDAIESAYFAFRRRLRNIKQSSSCECRACVRMQDLDFKFVCHHGAFIRQKMGGREELAGRDVILVHRLLKNDVSQKLDGRAYALYSAAAIRAMGVDPIAQGLGQHQESIDIIGEVDCWLRDLEQAWRDENEQARHEVTAAQAAFVIDFEIGAPRPVVWDYFTSPGQRPKWRAADQVIETVDRGRRGAGTVNHCMHGQQAVIEEVLDWRPFEYLTLTTLLPSPGAPKIPMTYAFFETAGGTNVQIRIAKPKPKNREFLAKVGETFKDHITHEVEALRPMIEGKVTSEAIIEEPALPGMGGRHVSQPLHRH